MILENKCSPAIIFIAFSMIQIIIDIFKNLYNTALIKFIVMIMFFIILNILCENGLTVLSWFIVFLPFVMMSIITTLILFVFGLSPKEETLNYKIDSLEKNKHPGSIETSVNTKQTAYSPKNIKDKDTIDITEENKHNVTDIVTKNMEDIQFRNCELITENSEDSEKLNDTNNDMKEENTNYSNNNINELLNKVDTLINKYN